MKCLNLNFHLDNNKINKKLDFYYTIQDLDEQVEQSTVAITYKVIHIVPGFNDDIINCLQPRIIELIKEAKIKYEEGLQLQKQITEEQEKLQFEYLKNKYE